MSELKEQKLLMVLRARPDNCSQVSTPNQKLQSQSQNNRTTSLAQCTWKSLTPWHSFTSGQTYSFNIVQMSLRAFQSVVLLSHSAVILSPQITKKKNSETQNNNTCCQKKPFIDKYHSPSFQAIYVPVEMRALIFFFCGLFEAALYFGILDNLLLPQQELRSFRHCICYELSNITSVRHVQLNFKLEKMDILNLITLHFQSLSLLQLLKISVYNMMYV